MVAMRLGPAQLVVQTVCVHNHLSIFEQPQTVTTTPMSGHELDAHYIYTGTVAGHRMSYHEYCLALPMGSNIEHLKNVT